MSVPRWVGVGEVESALREKAAWILRKLHEQRVAAARVDWQGGTAERCAVFAARLGVRMTRLGLSSASTRWGSASASGAIRLNWRLVHFGLPVIDYVVTHELAHLKEMNHSPAFWDVVRAALPDFEQARGALRTELLPAFD